ncbi:MarR family winged helix-turn-helix transcriptional regulator [Paraclostridium bifermentans]|uniref:MarR family winged helix-turn-helix transcriptional regulator n=1 Tax=Paraclostridium bifermentans TaxID=1490 RepID=UPI001C7EA9FA|nr:MarR family transcriptional regulator [Paraclostridium bifermentans]UOW68867.1 MarR family transcriptional regulator [Paraclostridium bifermentans]GIM32424.1 MarR family transcriptional regulator [Paraclostridium bifermentans subsp. muricolitidis]
MSYLILREIGKIARCLQTISDVEFREIGLEKGQYLFLVRICENPGINQEVLSNLLNVDRTTTAKAIKKLVEKDYVIKRHNAKDKRAYELYPSEKASQIHLILKSEEELSTENSLNGFSEEEVDILFTLLERMRKNIEKDWEYVKKGNKRDYTNK